MRSAHTWCRGARGRMCRLFIHAFARCANKCERDGCTRPASNVGDVQVVSRLANTLGRLRIMMPYCIQIRIPTVRCMGIDTEIALSRGNAPPLRERPPDFCFTAGPVRKTARSVEKIERKSFFSYEKKCRKMKDLFIVSLMNLLILK